MVPQCQVIDFLGLIIDTICMVIAMPQDKRDQILQELQDLLQLKKTTVQHMQRVAGRLNFITKAVPHGRPKAVPHGRPFSQRFYDAIAGLKQTWHVSVTAEIKQDVLMWCQFIQDYGGSTPICMPGTPRVHICTDATAAVSLDWGCGLVRLGFMTHGTPSLWSTTNLQLTSWSCMQLWLRFGCGPPNSSTR